MRKLMLPLALGLGLASLLNPSLRAQDRIRLDGGPTPDTAPAPTPHPIPHEPLAHPIQTLTPEGVPTDANPAISAPDAPTGPTNGAVDATTLKETIVTAHLREPMTAGKNILWCDTFQLVWDEATKTVGGPMTFDQKLPIADALNEHLASKADLDDASYLAMAGTTDKGIVDQIVAAMDKKFPAHDSFLQDSIKKLEPGPGVIVAFSYLQKQMQFATPLFKADKKPVAFQGKPVSSFGVWNEKGLQGWYEHAKQLRVIDHPSDADFMIELVTKATDDRLILAQFAPGKTLKETIDTAMARLTKAEPSFFEEVDEFKAPAINLHVVRSYTELVGQQFHVGESQLKREIALALQDTKFSLDEKGAELVSQAIMEIKPTGMVVQHEPRKFVCDKPFLVMMLRKGAKTPYFALWIANQELLTPVDAPAANAKAGHGRPSLDNDGGEPMDRAQGQSGAAATEAAPANATPPLRRPLTSPPQRMPRTGGQAVDPKTPGVQPGQKKLDNNPQSMPAVAPPIQD